RDGQGPERVEDLAERRAVRGDTAADPVRRAEEVPAVAVVAELDGGERRDADVDRLPARLREPVERLRGALDQLSVTRLATGVPLQARARHEPRTAALAADEPLPLERTDEPGRRALRKPEARREPADR